jgi:hypothetical protein
MDGGSGYAAIPAGSGTSAVVVKAAPGKLVRVIVITLGTAAMSFYDNPAAASGTVIFAVPASAPAGTVYELLIPATAGICAGVVSNSPAVVVTFY